jgi:hypothetical protein
LATLVSILNLPAGCINKIVGTACLFMVTLPGFSQRKYYEFNNPEALKLNKKRIELLTSRAWEFKQLDVYIRDDKSTYYPFLEKLVYRSDGTYSCRQMTGTWKVQYNRYLVHTAANEQAGPRDPVLGIYAVTQLNDNSLILTKLQSSAGDMKRSLTFNKWKDAPIDSFRKVFSQNEPVNFYVLPQRHSVPTEKLSMIDSLALVFIKNSGTHRREGSTIQSLNPYFRQYVGYMDKAGHHIVCLNALLTYHSNWAKDIILPSPEVKVEGFRVFVDLTKQECFGLNLYGD